MNTHQKRSVQAFRRVADWLVAHPVIAALVASFLTALNIVLAALNDAAVGQDSHFRLAKGAAAEGKQLRDALLRDHMLLISRAARATIPDVVQATASLHMPKKTLDAEGLRTAAEAMATAAEQHQDALVKGGLAPEALAQLREVAAQYKAAIDARGQSVAQRRGATKAVEVELRNARRLVDTLSVLVTRALRSDPAALAEWKQLKRITVKPVRASDESAGQVTPSPEPVPTPVVTPVTTPPTSPAA